MLHASQARSPKKAAAGEWVDLRAGESTQPQWGGGKEEGDVENTGPRACGKIDNQGKLPSLKGLLICIGHTPQSE